MTTVVALMGRGWGPEDWSALGTGVQAVATLLTLCVAVYAAYYAAGQVRQARAQVAEARRSREDQAEQFRQDGLEQARRDQRLREDQARPFVVVDFEPSPVWGNAIELVFENVGKTLAKDVRFTFDPPLETTMAKEGYDLPNAAIFRTGIPAMPPGKRFSLLFDLSHDRHDAGLPMLYRARVDLKDAQGRDQDPLEYVLDLAFRYGVRRFGVKTIHDAAKSLDGIEKSLAKSVAHFNGLRVWVRDEDAYLRAEEEDLRRRMGTPEPS